MWGDYMKKYIIMMMFILTIGLTSCDENTTTNNQEILEPYTIKTNITEYGSKSYIENSAGLPIISLSTEVRLDQLILADKVTNEELEEYFKLASDTGFNTLDLAFMWSSVETSKDIYDDTLINNILDLANEYNLMLNLNWYGSFVDGETRSAYIPDYIYENNEDYPFIADLYDFGVFGRIGIIDFSNENLMTRESKAIKALMDFVNVWSSENLVYPLVQVQIGQGLDRFPRWRINQYEVMDEGILMTSSKGWELVNGYIDNISSAVKDSNYKALTRVEFTEQNAVVNYVYNIYDLENVDLVSPTYLHQMPNVKSGMLSFQESFDTLPIYNAQNWCDDNSHRLVLASFALGGIGFNTYPLTFPRYYPVSNSGQLYGRYNPEGDVLFEEVNQRATDLRNIMLGLSQAYVDVAKTPRRNFLVLGLDNRISDGETQKLYTFDGLIVDSTMGEAGEGFVISNDGYVYVYTTQAANIAFSNVTFLNATLGYYDLNGDWISESDVALQNQNDVLITEAFKLYRLKVFNLNELPTNLSEDYISSYDAIRQ